MYIFGAAKFFILVELGTVQDRTKIPHSRTGFLGGAAGLVQF